MKKVLQILLPVVLMVLLTVTAAAQESNTIRGTAEIAAVPGGTVLYPIHIEGDLPLAACMLYVECDTDVFALAQDADGEYIVQPGGLTANGSLVANDYGRNGWRVAWINATNVEPDGVLFYLPLEVAEDAALGSYPVSIRISAANTINADGAPVACTAVDGEILIEADQPTLYTTEKNLVTGMVVDVPILLRHAPDLTGLRLLFEDNATAELVRDETGKPICTVSSVLTGSGTVWENTYQTDGWQMIWYNMQAQDINDLLVTLRIRILAEAGETVDLPVAVDRGNTVDDHYQSPDCVLKTVGLPASALQTEALGYTCAGETVTVKGRTSADPALNGDTLWLLAAAYDGDGRMIGLSDRVTATTDGTFSIELTAKAVSKVRLFMLDPVTCLPLQDVRVME